MNALDERLRTIRTMSIAAHREGRFSHDEVGLLEVMESEERFAAVVPLTRAPALLPEE